MPPTFGAGNSTQANSNANTTSLTIGSESDRVLYVFAGNGASASNAPSSATWNGVSLGAAYANGSLNSGGSGWWLYRVINPTAAAADVALSWPDTTQHNCMAFYYYDTDQTTPDDGTDPATGSGTAAQNTVTSATGDTGVAVCWTISTSTKAPASGETEQVDTGTAASALYELAGSASLSFDVTLGTSRAWIVLGLNLNAVAAGGGYTPRLTLLGVG